MNVWPRLSSGNNDVICLAASNGKDSRAAAPRLLAPSIDLGTVAPNPLSLSLIPHPLEPSANQSALEITWYQYLDFAEFLPPALKCGLSWVSASLEMGNQKWYPGRKSMWLIHLSIYPYFRKITAGTFSQDTCGRGLTPLVLWTESLRDPSIPLFHFF